MLKTVHNSGKILNLFTLKKPEWGVTEVAKVLKLPRANVGKILLSLAAENLIYRTTHGRYRLSLRMLELGQIMLTTSEPYNEVSYLMLELADTLRGNLYLARLNGSRVIIFEKYQVNLEIQKLLSNVGPGLPAHCSASGKTLLAYRDWQSVAALFEGQQLEKYTPHTTCNLEVLKSDLEQIRQAGYSCEKDEVTLGVSSLACPIFEEGHSVSTVIGLAVSSLHFEQQKPFYAKLMIKTAKQISEIIQFANDQLRYA